MPDRRRSAAHRQTTDQTLTSGFGAARTLGEGYVNAIMVESASGRVASRRVRRSTCQRSSCVHSPRFTSAIELSRDSIAAISPFSSSPALSPSPPPTPSPPPSRSSPSSAPPEAQQPALTGTDSEEGHAWRGSCPGTSTQLPAGSDVCSAHRPRGDSHLSIHLSTRIIHLSIHFSIRAFYIFHTSRHPCVVHECGIFFSTPLSSTSSPDTRSSDLSRRRPLTCRSALTFLIPLSFLQSDTLPTSTCYTATGPLASRRPAANRRHLSATAYSQPTSSLA
ncbi:hypothetical protein V8E36_005998 [Tilletia maclaganii]